MDSTGNDFAAPLGSFSGSVLADIDNDNDGDEPINGMLIALVGEDGVIVATTLT